MRFESGTYKKLYSYKHLINGFSVHTTPEQAESLRQAPGVKSVERDWKVGVWPTGGGCDRAGEDIVIGLLIQEYIHIILALQPTIPRHMDLFQNIEESVKLIQILRGTFVMERLFVRNIFQQLLLLLEHLIPQLITHILLMVVGMEATQQQLLLEIMEFHCKCMGLSLGEQVGWLLVLGLLCIKHFTDILEDYYRMW